MSELPPEIWLYISGFLSDTELRDLMAVNRIFYQISLDIRYREISITGINTAIVRLLERLRDPSISCRVQRLNIISTKTTPDSSVQNFRVRVTEALQALQMSLFSPVSIVLNTTRLGPAAPSTLNNNEATELLVTVLRGLTNVKRLTVDFWDPPTCYNVDAAFSTAWLSFGGQLRTLFLGGHLKTFRTIIESRPALPVLEELIFQLTDPFLITGEDNVSVLDNTVAPFINSLSPTLTKLVLWSWSSLDLSSLLTHLKRIPHLKKFHIRTPFNKAFVSDPSGLAHFIKTHRTTLEEIQLWLNPSGATSDSALDEPLSLWLSHMINDIPDFPRLKDLQMYPTRLPIGFDALTVAIARSLSSLTNLVVRDLYMSTTTLLRLLDALAAEGPNTTLRSLRMNVLSFNGSLFEAMATKLPALVSLSLYIGDSAVNAESFEDMLRGRKFDRWTLWNIGVWRSGSTLDGQSMLTIARSIPSVGSFWNKGHMDIGPGNAELTVTDTVQPEPTTQ